MSNPILPPRLRLALALLAALALPLRAADPVVVGSQVEDQERPLPKVTGWRLINIFDPKLADMRLEKPGEVQAEGKPKDNPELLKKIQGVVEDRYRKFQGDGDLQHVADLFRTHRFEEVEKLAKSEGGVKNDVSMELAQQRRTMVNQAMQDAIAKFDPEHKITIGMLDSGNKNSGIASDVDQTIFLVPKEYVQEMMKRAGLTESQLIDKAIGAFDESFKSRWGCTPDRLGIESMNGADFFPDWRAEHSLMEYALEVDRVVEGKRANPEAYRTEGQLKSQAEGRGYRALWDHSQKVVALDTVRSEVNEIRAADLSEAEKTAREKQVVEEFLKEYTTEDFKPRALGDVANELRRTAPWTEVGWDHSTNPPRAVAEHLVDTRKKVLQMEPEFARRFAFDGAWDNWMMFEAHKQNQKKYLLRSVAEGMSLLRAVEAGKGLTTFEYEKFYGDYLKEGNLDKLNGFIEEVYKPTQTAYGDTLRAEKVEHIRRVLDVAAKDRLRHKKFKKTDGTTFSDKEIYAEYLPSLTEQDARLYAGADESVKQKLEDLRMERAKREWASDARSLMITNLLRTVVGPAELLSGGINDAELRRLKASGHRAPSKAKLRIAVERSLYHGLHDIMSLQYAQALAEPDPAKRRAITEALGQKGEIAHRLLKAIDKVGDPDLSKRARTLAREAAMARLSVVPSADLPRVNEGPYRNSAFYEFLRTNLESKLKSGKEQYSQVAEDYKKGKYTREYVADKMVRMGMERSLSGATELANAVGFNVKAVNYYMPVLGGGRLPTFEVEFDGKPFSSRKMMSNLVLSGGNWDSAVQVALAYQERGNEAAVWAFGREVVLNLPGVAQGNAIYELVAHGRPQGVVMLGGAMLVPGLGQAYLAVSSVTGSVTLVGNYFLMPLNDDLADAAYQGFLSKQEAGWFRAGRLEDEEVNKRVSVLHWVGVWAVPEETVGEDGKKRVTYHVGTYDKETAFDLDFIESTVNDDYDYLRKQGCLGGGPRYEEWVAKTKKGYRLRFEAKRASLLYRYEKPVKAYLKAHAPDAEVFHVEDSQPHVINFFRRVVDNWCEATGEFSEFPENVIKSHRFTPELRHKMACRMAGDFFQSMEILREGEHSVEKSVRMACRKALRDRTAADANTLMVAFHEMRQKLGDPTTQMAIRQLLTERQEKARKSAPRIHVRPRLLTRPTGPDTAVEDIELLVSVVCDQEEFPPPYKVAERRVIEKRPAGQVLILYVKVFDSNGKEVRLPDQEVWKKEIGVVSKGLGPLTPKVKEASPDPDNGRPAGVEVQPPEVQDAKAFEVLRARKPDGPWVRIAEDLPADQRRSLTDSEPAGYRGTNTWYYTTLPKNRHQLGRPLENPDTSQSASITLTYKIAPPNTRFQSVPWDEYTLARETPEERAKILAERTAKEAKKKKEWDEERQRIMRQHQEAVAARAARRATTPPPSLQGNSSLRRLEERIREDKLRQAAETWGARTREYVSWDKPQPTGSLKDTKAVYLQLFRAHRPDGPYRLIKEVEADKGQTDGTGDTLPGMAYYYRARFVIKTDGGALFSDWSEFQGGIPENRFAHGTLGRLGADTTLGRCQVGPKQKLKITNVKLDAGVHSSEVDYKPHFVPHGPEGINEGGLNAFIMQERQQLIERFWKRYSERARRERAPELNRRLQKKLEDYKKKELPWLKANATMPGAPLGAVIGKFVSNQHDDEMSVWRGRREEWRKKKRKEARARGESWGEKDHANDADRPVKPEDTTIHFVVGKGVTFQSPDYGIVTLAVNWVPKGRRMMEVWENTYYTAEYSDFAAPGPVPSMSEPSCKRRGSDELLANDWDITTKLESWNPLVPKARDGKQPPRWQRLRAEHATLYGAPHEDGPWSLIKRGLTEFVENPVLFKAYDVVPGEDGYVRARLRYASHGRFLGEAWTAPVKLAAPDEELRIGNGYFRAARIAGRRGQTVDLTITGEWDIVKFDGLGKYGPEGIPEEDYQACVKKLIAVEKSQSPKERQSNQPNLFGATMDMAGGSTRTKPKGGLNNVEGFLKEKGSLARKEMRAGALMARFVRCAVGEKRSGVYFPCNWQHLGDSAVYMHTARTWSYTFPTDGLLYLEANSSSGWTGSHHVTGKGGLVVKVRRGAVPEGEGDDGFLDEWQAPKMPPPPKPMLTGKDDNETVTGGNRLNRTGGGSTTGATNGGMTTTARGMGAGQTGMTITPAITQPSTDNETDRRPPAQPQASETVPPAKASYDSGVSAWKSGNYQGAQQAFAEALRRDPANAEYLSSYGATLHQTGRYDEALQAHRKAIAIAPKVAKFRTHAALALREKGQLEQALKRFDEAAALDTGNAALNHERGLTLQRMKRWAEAEQAARRALGLQSGRAHYHHALGMATYPQRKYAEAERAFAKAVELAPRRAPYLNDLGNTQYAMGKLKEAHGSYMRAAKEAPKAGQYIRNAGYALEQLNDLRNAARAYRQATQLSPRNPLFHCDLGNILFRTQRWREAADAYAKAINLDPKSGQLRAHCAGALFRGGWRQEAMRQAQFAIQLGCKQHWVYQPLGLKPN